MHISARTYAGRISSLARHLARRHVGAMFLEPGSNFRYVTGLELGCSERLIAAVLTAGGELHLIGPAFEKERLCRCAAPSRIGAWLENQDPMLLVRDAVLSGSTDTIAAVGPTTRFSVVESLRVALPGYNIVDAGPIIGEARLTKDRAELSAMRAACRKTLEVMASVPKIARAGMTELELAREIGGGIVQFGENASIPHGGPSDRKLKAGDVILVDTGHTVDGYWSDLTRTFFFGRRTKEFTRVYEIVHKAQKAAIRAVKPGATCEAVDRAARGVIKEAGFGDCFIHRTGHGLGLEIHEPPYLVEGNETRLRAGMVMTIEPGIYLPGRFGVRIEDDVVVTRTGRKVLSSGR
jgi:Xaa-Pro dipeptidase